MYVPNRIAAKSCLQNPQKKSQLINQSYPNRIHSKRVRAKTVTNINIRRAFYPHIYKASVRHTCIIVTLINISVLYSTTHDVALYRPKHELTRCLYVLPCWKSVLPHPRMRTASPVKARPPVCHTYVVQPKTRANKLHRKLPKRGG